MKYLFVLNDPPYGTERSYNGLRLARELLKDKTAGNEVHVFLIGDAAVCAKSGQKVPQGYYHIESFLKSLGAAAAKSAFAAPAWMRAGSPTASSSRARGAAPWRN